MPALQIYKRAVILLPALLTSLGLSLKTLANKFYTAVFKTLNIHMDNKVGSGQQAD